jgi:hypothetical protein
VRTGREFNATFGEVTEAELGSLQVRQNPDRSPGIALYSPDRHKPGMMIAMAAVTEIESKNVDPRRE